MQKRNPVYKSCEVKAKLNGVDGLMWNEYYSESNREDYKCFFRPYGSDEAIYLPDSDNTENLFWSDENCDGCANQESIAAPGETTKCRKHQEKSDDEIDQWFIERASEFEFHPFVTTCAMCFKREAFYVGVTTHGTPFEFCRVCRDNLVRRADAAKQLLERFGV